MDEEVHAVQIIQAVQDVYTAQDIKVKEARSAAAVSRAAEEIDEDADMVGETGRRRSGSSVASNRDQTFATVMAAFLPKPPPVVNPPAPTDWFQEAGINDEQRKKMMLNFPAGTKPTLLLLSALEEDDLLVAGLMPAQLRAFKKLQQKYNEPTK